MNKKSYNVFISLKKDITSSWMDPVYSSTTSIFSKQYGLEGAFTEVGLSSDWGTMSPSEDERICDKYGACVIPFYDCAFSLMGIRLHSLILR